MKEDHLTVNAIDKLIAGVSGVIIQFLSVSQKVKNGQKFYGCQLNDGFCRLKSCLVVDEEIFTANKAMKEGLVAKVNRSMYQKNKAKEPIIIIESYLPITDEIQVQIGKPIPYDEFLRKDKKNPQGSNYFAIPTKGPPASKYDFLLEDTRSQEESNARTRPPVKEKVEQRRNESSDSKNSNPKGQLRLSNQEGNSRNRSLNQSRENNTNSNNSNNTSKQTTLNLKNQNSNQVGSTSRPKSKLSPPKNQQNQSRGPIEKLNNVRSSPAVRGNQNRPLYEYNQIKSLYLGMQNFVILGRILFVFPIKTFVNKKGIESSLLSIQIGDKSGVIECTMFGQTAQRFEGKFKEDQIYEIAQAIVTENVYLGVHTLRITINETTRVSLKEDDPNVPMAEDFCITVKQLMELPVGEVAKVICLVKDGQVKQFTSKAGKQMKNKVIMLCDPIDKLQVDATIWDEKKLEQPWERQPYMITGVIVKEYRENKQYQLKNNYVCRVLKHHSLRKYLGQMDSIQFSNPDSAKKKRGTLSNLEDINNLMDEISPHGSWSEVVCTFSSFNTALKNIYFVCPHCSKKVIEKAGGQCQNCSKQYEDAVPKYNVNFTLSDAYSSVFASAFDKPSQKILGISASEYVNLGEEGIEQLNKSKEGLEMKLKMVTNNEEYQGQVRKKTKIIDVLPLNYAAESRQILDRLHWMMGK